MKKRIVFFAGILIALSGCENKKEDLLFPNTPVDCTLSPASFKTDIQPMMMNNCATSGCRNSGDAAAGVILETYTQIKEASSRIHTEVVVDKTMPVSGPLSSSEINKIRCWVSSGSPNN